MWKLEINWIHSALACECFSMSKSFCNYFALFLTIVHFQLLEVDGVVNNAINDLCLINLWLQRPLCHRKWIFLFVHAMTFISLPVGGSRRRQSYRTTREPSIQSTCSRDAWWRNFTRYSTARFTPKRFDLLKWPSKCSDNAWTHVSDDEQIRQLPEQQKNWNKNFFSVQHKSKKSASSLLCRN